MREAYVRTYIGVLAALALALAACWVYVHGLALEPRFVVGAVVFAVLILLGGIFPISVSEETDIGVWDIGLVLAVAVLGPTWAAIAVLPAALYAGRQSLLRGTFEVCHTTVVVYLAGIVYSLASAPLLFEAAVSTTAAVYGTLAAGAVFVGANETIMATLLKIKYGRDFGETWKEEIEPYLPSYAINVLTAGLGILVFFAYGPVAAVAAVGGAIGSLVLVHRSRDRVAEIGRLKARVSSLEEALSVSNVTFGTIIVRDLGRKDGFTHRHAAATAVYAADLGREMGLDEARVGRLRMAGLLHNVGLFGLPEELLGTTGKLNSIAQSRYASHPARGAEALAAIPEFEEMASWVRWHHERPDGRGYPDKLRGAWIPLEAKILAVAQAYAGLVLDGPTRPGVGRMEARKELGAGAETEFDGVVVRAFLRILDTESEGYRMADDHRFVFPDPEDHGRERSVPADDQEGGALSLPR